MSNEVLKKFSEELKSTRKKKKLTLDKIFNKTRIDIKYLEAIEDGNFSIMPDVYIRAFLKEYAKSIGQDENETLEKYKIAQSGKIYSDVEPEITEKKTEPIKLNDDKSESPVAEPNEIDKPLNTNNQKSIKKTLTYVFSATVMFVVIYLMYNTLLEETTVVEEKPFAEVLKSQDGENTEIQNDVVDISKRENIDAGNITLKKVEKVQASNSKVNEKKQTAQLNKLNLTISGTSRSWMRILIDDEKTNEFIIDSGIKKDFYADEKFYLHIGNSGGVKLFLNGNDLQLNGSEGRVRKIAVTKDGIEYLRRKDFLSNE